MSELCNIPVFEKMNKNQCCGCEACANICPIDIISFCSDEEGFRYPVIEKNKCLSCGRCAAVCPALNISDEHTIDFSVIAGYSNNDYVLENSSSGGFFSHVAEMFLSKYPGAYICGVIWNDDFSFVEHVLIDNKNLTKLRSSKYIQSRKNKIYKEVKKILDYGKPVLFVGTGCEVTALHNVLGKDYPLLYTIDLICKGPCSERAFNEYKRNLTKKYHSNVHSINMRYIGWKTWIPQWIKIEFENKKTYKRIFYTTNFGRAFYLMQRRSCSECHYSGNRRMSDLTLGDFHGADERRNYYNPKGVSVAIANNDKGKQLIEMLISSDITYESVQYEDVAKANPCLVGPVSEKENRATFSETMIKKGLSAAVKRTYPVKERIVNHMPPAFAEKCYRLIHGLRRNRN